MKGRKLWHLAVALVLIYLGAFYMGWVDFDRSSASAPLSPVRSF